MGKKYIRMQITKLISYEIQFWEKILYSRLSKGIEKILSDYDSNDENEHILELNEEQKQKENQDITIKEEPLDNNRFNNQFIENESSDYYNKNEEDNQSNFNNIYNQTINQSNYEKQNNIPEKKIVLAPPLPNCPEKLDINPSKSNDLLLKNHAKLERDKFKYKGIYFHKNRWEPSIKYKGKRYYAKGFQSIELAAQAYDSLVYYFYGFEKGLSKFNHIYTDSTQIKSIFELKKLDKTYKLYNYK